MAVALLLTVVAALAASAPGAGASELPECHFPNSFATIHGPSDPEECFWELHLGEEQVARQQDDQHIAVYYTGHLPAYTITAQAAHDAEGTAVPTTLRLSGRDIAILTVHHRAGNPAAGGAPFDYPIVDGAGWEGGSHTTVVEMSPPQPVVSPAGESPPTPVGPTCGVPSLEHESLHRARTQLRAAGCALAHVHRRPGVRAHTGRVVRQTPPPGTEGALGLSVTITLGAAPG
jgi:hypothetical protein